MANFEISTASAAELSALRGWAEDEGWNPGRHDALPFQAADPRGFFVGRLDGVPVAAVSGVRYGEGHGFLGMYVTRPSVRGQGYGIRLWRAAVAHLAGRNVGLDGVVAQQENYRRSGFRRAWNHIRYSGVPEGSETPRDVTLLDGRSVPFQELAAYDRRFFPAPRAAFLSLWVGLPSHTSLAAVRDGELEGFAVARPAQWGSRIGPVYASSPRIALALVGRLSAAVPGTVTLDVPDLHDGAVDVAERLGLQPVFECARMYTGDRPDVDFGGVFAATTVELG